jgi:hypothetical protein
MVAEAISGFTIIVISAVSFCFYGNTKLVIHFSPMKLIFSAFPTPEWVLEGE